MGRIDLGDNGGDNDTANVYGGGVSSHLTFENTEKINLFGAGVVRTGVTGGSTTITKVITVDTTGESTRGVALAGMTSSVHGIISQRMNQTPQYQPIQLAALEVSPSMLYTERKPMAWAQFFGGKFNRDAEGDALGYDYDHAGVNVGYEWDVTETRFGLMGGFVKSDTDTEASSFSSEANNFYVGAYGNRKFGGISMTGSLIAGYSDFDNERRVIDNLNGIETATSDFDSFFVSPSVTLASAYTLTGHWEFRPSTSLSYSMAWLDSYSETGTTNSNLTVDDRKAKALNARAQLAAAYLISARSEIELRLGLNSRNPDDDDTNVSIGGSQFKFANAGDENVTGGFAGASFRIFNENNLTLVADVEVGGNSDEDYVAGNLNLEYLL
jgi:outer membrane autotransporter protein